MHGGVILFRGTGADAMRYVEADRSRADDYYLSDGAGIAYAVLDASGTAVKVRPAVERGVRRVGGLDPPGYG